MEQKTEGGKIRAIAARAKLVIPELSALSSELKTGILHAMADAITERQAEILNANSADIARARKAGLSLALIDRLSLDEKRILGIVRGLSETADLPDPIGKLLSESKRPNGLVLRKIRVPLGVIGIIYESRPNVTAEAVGLCVKSSNAVLLRGGSEAIESNTAIASILRSAGESCGLPRDTIQFIPNVEREVIYEMSRLEGLIDLLILRGGEALIRSVREHARVPIMKHYKGVCHLFVDESADFDMATRICVNAKCQRPGTCNALETLLVHRSIAERFLLQLVQALRKAGVELRGDEESRRIVPDMRAATDEDWSAEYLDLILAIRVVANIDEAVKHIREFGSQHSDSIVTSSEKSKSYFIEQVDSAVVYVNASTRFTDGGEFGLGGEIGISTDKLHARGPVGVEELTTYKYVVLGDGHIRE